MILDIFFIEKTLFKIKIKNLYKLVEKKKLHQKFQNQI